eukprot:9485540-Pyramimonas_sp.AAC.1
MKLLCWRVNRSLWCAQAHGDTKKQKSGAEKENVHMEKKKGFEEKNMNPDIALADALRMLCGCFRVGLRMPLREPGGEKNKRVPDVAL